MKKKHQSRRWQSRVPYDENVLINGALRVRAIDISEGGIYLHTGRSFPEGTIVEVSFPLFYDTLIAQAEVRFSHEGVGMGLMFTSLDARQKSFVKRYITEALERPGEEDEGKNQVLLIGENEMAMKMYRSEFTLAQFSVFQSVNDAAAMDVLRDHRVGVIVLALNMEIQENFNTLSLLELSPLARDIPVLVVSPANLPGTRKRVIDAGADIFMEKMVAAPKKLVEEAVKLSERGKV